MKTSNKNKSLTPDDVLTWTHSQYVNADKAAMVNIEASDKDKVKLPVQSIQLGSVTKPLWLTNMFTTPYKDIENGTRNLTLSFYKDNNDYRPFFTNLAERVQEIFLENAAFFLGDDDVDEDPNRNLRHYRTFFKVYEKEDKTYESITLKVTWPHETKPGEPVSKRRNTRFTRFKVVDGKNVTEPITYADLPEKKSFKSIVLFKIEPIRSKKEMAKYDKVTKKILAPEKTVYSANFFIEELVFIDVPYEESNVEIDYGVEISNNIESVTEESKIVQESDSSEESTKLNGKRSFESQVEDLDDIIQDENIELPVKKKKSFDDYFDNNIEINYEE